MAGGDWGHKSYENLEEDQVNIVKVSDTVNHEGDDRNDSDDDESEEDSNENNDDKSNENDERNDDRIDEKQSRKGMRVINNRDKSI